MTDRRTVFTVVVLLGLLALGGLGAGVYLSATHNGVPDFVVATTSASMGALAAVLAKTSTAPEK